MVEETRALLDGLRCCKAYNMSKMIVESDSKVLIDLIDGKGQIPWAIQYLWKEIQPLLCILSPTCNHQFREGNSVADALANFAIQRGKLIYPQAVNHSHINR
ncbi:uncharacterized protein LOC143892421 [Tasmannia lanceolata]|uniref:uncharacterized protein LOC143892421 n=1 Tax=Tasmannia lanceolata TaxID=3420 RepID=UPI004063873F